VNGLCICRGLSEGKPLSPPRRAQSVTPTLPSATGYADPVSPGLASLTAVRPRIPVEWNRRPTWRRARALARSAARNRGRACRFLNVSVALFALILGAPVMLLIAALVKVTSPGPAIYAQPRVGLNRRRRGPDRRRSVRNSSESSRRRQNDRGGRIFTIYKFRTMRTDRPAAQVWSCKDDPRVTPLGRFLRATRLDELPQLFNVLKGDMNIVGPRPEQPEIFQELSQSVGSYRERQRVLPGITGLAQVSMGYDQSLEDVRRKVGFDLEYIQGRSAAKDLMIMARTMPVMVMRRMWM
jgi:lipopolysaccharide/colanic/teichoic acid biosynthesis glycosyltransferase